MTEPKNSMPNISASNGLWLHCDGTAKYLSSVCVKQVQWLSTGKSSVTLEGLLIQDKWLFDIYNKQSTFEVRTGECGNPTEYKTGKTLLRMENLKSFRWWTKDVVSRENNLVCLYCQFICDWVKL